MVEYNLQIKAINGKIAVAGGFYENISIHKRGRKENHKIRL